MLYHTFTTKIQNSVIVNKFTELCIHHKELLCTFIVMSISTHPQTTTNLLSVSIVFMRSLVTSLVLFHEKTLSSLKAWLEILFF